jgi:hypothetical protein
MEGGDGRRQHGRGVAFDDDPIGFLQAEHPIDALQHTSRDAAERLVLGHDPEVVVGGDPESGQNVVDQRAVLRGEADLRLDGWPSLPQGQDHR